MTSRIDRMVVSLIISSCALLAPIVVSAQVTAAKCKDGTTSSASGRGACAGHGGVDKGATKRDAKAAKSEVSASSAAAKTTAGAEVTLTCADGSISHAKGRGACSGHGGVKAASATSKVSGVAIPVPGTATPPSRQPTAPVANEPAPSRPSSSAQNAGQSGDTKVWVNTKSGVYHCPGTRWYGATKSGQYMTEREARAAGDRPAYGRACS
jgi:hypothetical protein